MIKFHKFAATSPSVTHIEKGEPSQDFSDTFEFDNVQIIAVADGHGGSAYFRSEYGSKIAIQTLFEQIKIFCKSLKDSERLSDTGIKNFKYNFVRQWKKEVKKDWDERLSGGNLGEGEPRYKSVSEKYKARYTSDDPKIVEKYLYSAYGTTLIGAISIGTQILILQIGDGSCGVLLKNGEFISPIPGDSENFLNVTTSLCNENAELKIRHAVLECGNSSANSPVAVFLSTDGLDNCFPYYKNDEHLYNFYGVVIKNMLDVGYTATEEEIKTQLLAGLTKKSSHDDISLAYFVPEDIEFLRETYEKITDEKITDEKITDEKITDEKITDEKISDEKISAEKITDEKTSDEKISNESIQISPLPVLNTAGGKILKANEFFMSQTPVTVPASIKQD